MIRTLFKSPIHITNWFLLAFLAGSVNSGGYIVCQRFVSHVTGFATLFGVEWATHHFVAALELLSVPLFFLLGAVIATLTPKIEWAMGLECFLLWFAAVGGHLEWFGHFSDHTSVEEGYLLMATLCLASGIQNAVITSVSKGVIRTTHLTGVTTDLGIGIGRLLMRTQPRDERKREVYLTLLRSGIIASFALGAAVGAWLGLRYGVLGFVLPAVLATYATLAGRFLWL